MKRAPVMKNAPKIDLGAVTTVPANQGNQNPTAPAVANLSERVRGMSQGNSITQAVCGRDVVFTLKVIPAARVSKATMVWAGNERDQELLTESALSDLIPSFESEGQQFPAYGREESGIIEVADGSRRRRTAILTNRDYRVLVGNLDEEQMAALSETGNFYRPTSAFERGQRYARRLKNEFEGNVSKLAEAENISRKIISRCVATAELPRHIINLFANPNELSARSGEALAKYYRENTDAVELVATKLANQKINGEQLETDDLSFRLMNCAERGKPSPVRVRTFGTNIKATYKPTSVAINLKNAPAELLSQIEALLEEHAKRQAQAQKQEIDSSLSELDNVVTMIRKVAEAEKYALEDQQIASLIPTVRIILANDKSDEWKTNEVAEYLKCRFAED